MHYLDEVPAYEVKDIEQTISETYFRFNNEYFHSDNWPLVIRIRDV